MCVCGVRWEVEGQTARAQQDCTQPAGCHLPPNLLSADLKDLFMSLSLSIMCTHNTHSRHQLEEDVL